MDGFRWNYYLSLLGSAVVGGVVGLAFSIPTNEKKAIELFLKERRMIQTFTDEDYIKLLKTQAGELNIGLIALNFNVKGETVIPKNAEELYNINNGVVSDNVEKNPGTFEYNILRNACFFDTNNDNATNESEINQYIKYTAYKLCAQTINKILYDQKQPN